MEYDDDWEDELYICDKCRFETDNVDKAVQHDIDTGHETFLV